MRNDGVVTTAGSREGRGPLSVGDGGGSRARTFPFRPLLLGRRAAAVSALAVVAFAPATVAAEEAAPRGLDLGTVLETTLSSNPGILVAEQQVEVSRGALLLAGAAFDSQLQADVLAGRLHTADPVSGAPAVRHQMAQGIAAQRRFRNGLVLSPELRLTRTGYSTLAGTIGNAASVTVGLGVPLLNDRGGKVSGAPERAAAYEYRSGQLALDHTVAQRLLTATIAYWDYLTAQSRLDISLASEKRAERTTEETRALVKADERTAADLTQILGNLALKRVSRITAEQAVVEARQQLGLAIGIPAEQILRLPTPITGFPEPPADVTCAARAEELTAEAFAQRADLAGAGQDLLSAQTQMEAARNDLKPRLDLNFVGGFTATEQGRGVDAFFSPLFRHSPKLDASVHLQLELPIGNTRARGRLMQSASIHEQQRLFTEDLRRQIATGVVVACEALVRGAAGMRQAQEAVALAETSVQAEQRKFQFGVSTLFDVIQAQDGLNSALLSRVQSQRNYVVAIATLRYQSGTIVRERGAKATAAVEDLLKAP